MSPLPHPPAERCRCCNHYRQFHSYAGPDYVCAQCDCDGFLSEGAARDLQCLAGYSGIALTRYRCQRAQNGHTEHMDGSFRWTRDAIGHIWDVRTVGVANVDRTKVADTQVGGGHYRETKLQPWDVIDAWGLDFYAGNALKYLYRAGRKGSKLEDLKKARHYLDKMIEKEES